MDLINFSRQQASKALRYSLVGLFNTAFCLTIISLLAYCGFHYITYTIISYLLAMTLSFFLNLRFTFRQTGFVTQRIMWFFIINLINLAMVVAIEHGLINTYLFPHHWAVLIGMACYIILGFVLNQLIAFRPLKDIRYA